MPSERRRRAHLEQVIRSEETAHDTTYGFTASAVPATGPQGSRANLALLETAPPPSRLYAAAISRPQREVVPTTRQSRQSDPWLSLDVTRAAAALISATLK